ncbi:hypothetical protein [Halomonas sp. FL8]
MAHWPRQVRLVHGERQAKQALKRALLAMAKTRGVTMDVVIP